MTQTKATDKLGLRWRIMLALVLITTVTSCLFAYGVIKIKAGLETVIFDNMVREQFQVLVDELEQGHYQKDALFRHWSFYYGEHLDGLHPRLQTLTPGSHHSIKAGEHYYQVEVGSYRDQPAYLTYDITEWEHQEHALLEWLLWGVGMVMVVAVVLGLQATQTILAPVKALTERLATIQPRQRGLRIAQEFQGNEIGQIARAFDQYLVRLDQFVERERSFTDAASHELRTPLSVMMGAIDVLETQSQNPTSHRALNRLKRACDEMRAFVEATLFLAREDGNTIQNDTTSPVADIIRTLLEDYSLPPERNLTITTQLDQELQLAQPDSMVKIMIGNILRNAIEHTSNGVITITANANSLCIEDTGSGIPAADLPRIFERDYTTKTYGIGLGLNLVKRICDRFNWQIKVTSEVDKGTSITILFED